MLLFLGALMLVLSWADFSYVLPATAAMYAIVPLLGHFCSRKCDGAALGGSGPDLRREFCLWRRLLPARRRRAEACELRLTLIILVLAGTGGDISVAHAMKRLGEVQSFSPWYRAFSGSRFPRGLDVDWHPQLTLAFCSLLFLLSWEAVSFVVPAMALSYVTGAIGGKYFLGEKLTPWRWAGIALVSVGVALVCLG